MAKASNYPDKSPAFSLPAFRPWREISILAIIIMEMCWLVPWFRSLTPATYATDPLRAFVVFAGIVLSSHWLSRGMNYLQLKMSIRRALLLVAILVSILVGLKLLLYSHDLTSISDLLNRPVNAFSQIGNLIPDEFLISVFVLIASWRGIQIAQEYIEPRTVKRNFIFGILMFVAFIFINTMVTGETPGILLFLFFFTGLIALSTARISVITTMRGGILSKFDRRWFLGMFGAAIIVVGLSGFISWFFSERVRLIEQLGSVVLSVFAIAIVGMISPVIFAVESLVGKANIQSNALQNLLLALESFRTVISEAAKYLFGFMERVGFLEWLPILKPILLWGFILLIAFLVISSIAQWVIKEKRNREEERGSVLSTGELLQLLKNALQSQLKKLGENLAGVTHLLPRRGWFAAARIRRIYAELMELGEKLGKPRPQSHTPLEYLPDLATIFPELTQDLTLVTSAYLQVRYGEIPETPEALEQVESAWARIRAQGKDVLELRTATQKKTSNK